MSFMHPTICAILYGSRLALTFIENISPRFWKPRRLPKVLKNLKFFEWWEVCFPPGINPGRNGYIVSCRTAFKSVAIQMIGFGRLLVPGFRSNPLFLYDIRWSESPSSYRFHTVGTGQIQSQDLLASGVIRGNLMSRNGRNLRSHMTPDFMIKLFNHCHRNLSDYIRIQ